MTTKALSKSIEKEAINIYLQSFDEEDVGRFLLGDKGKVCDPSIARINGRQWLKNKKINDAIDKIILQKKLDANSLKVDAYKLSRLDSDGRVKVKALEILGKWQKLEDPAVSNIFNVNMTWASAVMQAHQSKRKVEVINEEKEIKQLPAEELTIEPESD